MTKNLKILCLLTVFGIHSAYGQNDPYIFDIQNVIRYSDTTDLKFSFQEESQGLFFGEIPVFGKHQEIYPQIYNHSEDTILVIDILSTDGAVRWILEKRKPISIPPNKYLTLKGYWEKRLGNFSRPIRIKYTQNQEEQILEIKTWGVITPYEWYKGEKVNQWKGSYESGKFGKWYFLDDNNRVDKAIFYTNGESQIIYEELFGFTKLNDNFIVKFDTIPFVTQYFYKTNSKEKEIFINGRINKYYKTGQLKSILFKTSLSDSVPLYTEFYQSGSIKGKSYKDSSIWFYESGSIQSLSANGSAKFYYDSGELMKLTASVGLNNDSMPKVIEFYPNGCVKNRYFNTNHNIHYAESNCDCPVKETFGRYDTTFVFYKNCIPHQKKYSLKNKNTLHWGYALASGQFSELYLTNGNLKYYNSKDELIFSFQKNGGQIQESFIYLNKIYNNKSENVKTGIWIKMRHDTTSFSVFLANNPDANIFNYVHETYRDGELLESIYYYPNGFLASKTFVLDSTEIVLNYSESKSGIIISGERGSSEMIYENGKLIQIISPKTKWIHWKGVEHDVGQREENIPYTVERGQFKKYKIYNGYIDYHNANGVRTNTIKVVNGIKQ